MEILRKRTRGLCDRPTPDSINNSVMVNGGVDHVAHKHMPAVEHMQFQNTDDLTNGMGPADDNIFGLVQEKRKCNGVSSYIADHAREPINTMAASVENETVAMVTDANATSYHSNSIPTQPIHHGSQIMTGAGDVSNSSAPQQPQNQMGKVCPRCLFGGSGHITHIMS